MVENGSNGGARPLPPNGFHPEPHAEFLELCAIATTGYLSEEEQRRLDEHLPRCARCRERLAQYEAVIAGAIPVLAPKSSLSSNEQDVGHWTPTELSKAETALFARLNDEETREGRQRPKPEGPRDATGEALWRHVWWQYAAGLLLSVAFGVALYRTGIRHGTESAKATPAAGQIAPAVQGTVEAQTPSSKQSQAGEERASDDAQSLALRAQLDERSAEIDTLKAQQAQLTKEVADGEADRTRLVGASEQAKAEAAQLQQAQADLDVARKKLDAATGTNQQDAARVAALEQQVDRLTGSLHGRDQELAREQELLDHDHDIRELMGSRDLYIAEVYDVAKTGDTKKPFGRVFYTKAKSLIFYAYDLDQQAGVKDTSTFQVWGRRGPDKDEAVNLGILYQDNASKKRWVMKADNAKTLAGIDAVFVTVEPKGRSQHPSGKPLLFAYLKMEPNHP